MSPTPVSSLVASEPDSASDMSKDTETEKHTKEYSRERTKCWPFSVTICVRARVLL